MRKVPVQKVHTVRKSTGIVDNTVANVVAALLTYQLHTMLVQFIDPVSHYVIEWPIFPIS